MMMLDLSTAYMNPPTPGTVSLNGPIGCPRYEVDWHCPEKCMSHDSREAIKRGMVVIRFLARVAAKWFSTNCVFLNLYIVYLCSKDL